MYLLPKLLEHYIDNIDKHALKRDDPKIAAILRLHHGGPIVSPAEPSDRR